MALRILLLVLGWTLFLGGLYADELEIASIGFLLLMLLLGLMVDFGRVGGAGHGKQSAGQGLTNSNERPTAFRNDSK